MIVTSLASRPGLMLRPEIVMSCPMAPRWHGQSQGALGRRR